MPMSSDSWPKSKPTTDILVVRLVEKRLYWSLRKSIFLAVREIEIYYFFKNIIVIGPFNNIIKVRAYRHYCYRNRVVTVM